LDSGEIIPTSSEHQGYIQGCINALTVVPDGRRALFASSRGPLKLWDLDRGEIIRTFESHHDPVTAVAVLPDGRRALSGSDDGTLTLWDIAAAEPLAAFTADAGIGAVAIANDALFVAGAADGAVHFLRLLT